MRRRLHHAVCDASFACVVGALVLAGALCLALLGPRTACATQTVRVGVVEQEGQVWPDDEGYEHGFDAEYTYKVAQYAGFDVEFVPFENYEVLLDALEQDQIQMSVGVSKTTEREERFLFADTALAQGAVSLYAAATNDSLAYGDLEAIGASRIGGVEGSSLYSQAQAWAQAKGISPTFVTYQTETELYAALDAGEIDLVPLVSSISQGYRKVCQVSTTAYYFVFNAGEEELCSDVNEAMTRILSEDSEYAAKVLSKYSPPALVEKVSLTEGEQAWLDAHPTIRVAVTTDDAPYYSVNAKDEESGIVVSLYRRIAQTIGAEVEFVAFDTKDETLEAVRTGDADIVGIVGEDVIMATKEGLVLTKVFSTAGIDLVTANGVDSSAVKRVAVPNDDLPVLMEPVQNLGASYEYFAYDRLGDCLAALKTGSVDAVLCDSSQATWLMNQNREGSYDVTSIGGAVVEHAGAVAPDNAELGAIVSKATQSSGTYMATVIAQNTVREKDIQTFFQTLPVWVYLNVCLLVVALVVLAALLFLRTREQRNKILLAEANTEAEAARRAHEAEGAFLSSMSHDMRTPLNGILGFTTLALGTKDEDLRQDYLEKIDTAGHLMLDIVNDVLDLSKIESGKMEMHPAPANPRETFDKLTSSVQMLATNRGQELKAHYENPAGTWVTVDQVRLQQVLLNLLSNAIKYTPEDGIVSWALSVKEDGSGRAVMRNVIADTGIGMSKEFQKKMFEPFSQEEQLEARHVRGTGLGLSIVKHTVDEMGGTIEVKSAQGKGTTFIVTLTLPVAEPAEDAAQGVADGDTQANTNAETSIAGMRVLLCEDNVINAELARTILANAGIEHVDWVEDGAQGVDAFEKSDSGTYDVVLMDLRMPVMGGIEATERIRALDREDARTVPIIAMTADAYSEDAARCKAAGMNAHVAKPIDVQQLMAQLVRFKRVE